MHLKSKSDFVDEITERIYKRDYLIQARFACLRCAADGHSLRSPGVTLVHYKGDSISKYV